jgi:hypothetical protein
MKKILLLISIFTLSTAVLQAQEKMEKSKSKMHHDGMEHKMKDCVMMKDGKMMVMKGGNTMDMSQDMTLTNGTTVATDGTVKMKNGKTMKMKDGDAMYMNGKMEKMKMKSKDSKM